MDIQPKPPQASPLNPVASSIKYTTKLTISGIYVATGLSMMALSASTVFYSVLKLNQFYFPEPEPIMGPQTFDGNRTIPSSNTNWTSDDPPEYKGFGQGFENICIRLSHKINFQTGPILCENLAKQSWADIRSIDTITAAIFTTIIGEGAILYVSTALFMGGISMVSRGFSLLYSATFED